MFPVLTILFCTVLIIFLYEYVKYRQHVKRVKAGFVSVYKPTLLYVVIIGIIADSLVYLDKVLGD